MQIHEVIVMERSSHSQHWQRVDIHSMDGKKTETQKHESQQQIHEIR